MRALTDGNAILTDKEFEMRTLFLVAAFCGTFAAAEVERIVMKPDDRRCGGGEVQAEYVQQMDWARELALQSCAATFADLKDTGEDDTEGRSK